MAGHRYNVAMPTYKAGINGTKTLFQLITPGSRRLWIPEIHISGRSVAASDIPYIVKFVRQTSAGTSSSTITPAPIVEGHPAALITVNSDFTAEPTDAGAIVRGPWLISPVGTTFDFPLPLGEEIEMAVSARLGLIVITPQPTDLLAVAVVME